MKVIAVDIDNVLNNFSDTLAKSNFTFNDSYGLSCQDFEHYLTLLKQDAWAESEFLTSKFSDFRHRIHAQCYLLAQAKPGSVQFMNWLKANDWKIIICTKRNLRLVGECTKKWLADNHIPYDYLVMSANKIVFCKLWNVPYLIDDDILNIIHGEQYGIQVYYPIMSKHSSVTSPIAKGFSKFEELEQCLPK